MTNFIEKCITGETTLDKIDDYIDLWHTSETEQTLYDFLGFTKIEYAKWIQTEITIEEIKENRRII